MKLVILEPIGIAKNELFAMAKDALGSEVDLLYYDTRVEDSETLIERSKDADAVVLSNLPYKKEVIEKCPNLKIICVAFTGVDHVALDFCKEKNIMVCNCAGYSTVAVSELVFGIVISLYRNIIFGDKVTREGGSRNGHVGFELKGKKFGVVGAGEIGMRTAMLAKAFGCEVYAYSRTKKEIEVIEFVDLDTLMATCDIISIHVPLNETTKGLIDNEKLSLMKEKSILINTARGGVVNSKDLAEALNSGKIAGAGIDVFEVEPPIPTDHVLFEAKNLIVTPHIAFATQEAFEKRAIIVFDNIKKWLEGTPQNVM